MNFAFGWHHCLLVLFMNSQLSSNYACKLKMTSENVLTTITWKTLATSDNHFNHTCLRGRSFKKSWEIKCFQSLRARSRTTAQTHSLFVITITLLKRIERQSQKKTCLQEHKKKWDNGTSWSAKIKVKSFKWEKGVSITL